VGRHGDAFTVTLSLVNVSLLFAPLIRPITDAPEAEVRSDADCDSSADDDSSADLSD
jgi:hypothetical protein